MNHPYLTINLELASYRCDLQRYLAENATDLLSRTASTAAPHPW